MDDDSEISSAEKAGEYAMYQKYDTLKSNYSALCESGSLDSLQKDIFPKNFKSKYDTINQTIGFVRFKGSGITRTDLYIKSDETLLDMYISGAKKRNPGSEISSIHRSLAKQAIKMQKHPLDYLKFSVKNLLWGVILLTILIAGLFKLLYIRHNSFYAEHITQVINYHCVIVLLSSLYLLIHLTFGLDIETLFGVSGLLAPIFIFICLKRYYNEHFIKTFIKVSIVNLFYFIFAMILALLMFLLSLMIF